MAPKIAPNTTMTTAPVTKVLKPPSVLRSLMWTNASLRRLPVQPMGTSRSKPFASLSAAYGEQTVMES